MNIRTRITLRSHAMRAAQPAHRAAARRARPHAEPARAIAGRHHPARLAAPVAADRARRQRLRPAIPRGRARRPAGRLLRPAVRRRHYLLAAAVGTDGQHLPYRSACAPATAFISRSRSRPRRIVSATTSRPASACARPPTCSSTPITIPASKCRRRSRSTAGSTPSCRPRSSIARRWCRIALAAGRAKAGPRRLK